MNISGNKLYQIIKNSLVEIDDYVFINIDKNIKEAEKIYQKKNNSLELVYEKDRGNLDQRFHFILINSPVLSFTISSNGFTQEDYNNNYNVYLDNIKTDMSINNIVINNGTETDVIIERKSKDVQYPLIYLGTSNNTTNTTVQEKINRRKNSLVRILEPFPLMYDISLVPITAPKQYFTGSDTYWLLYGALQLEYVCDNLLINNPQITDFSYCFRGCTKLENIPSSTFTANEQATNFLGCFYECSSLISVPNNLFSKNINTTSFTSCFRRCTNLQTVGDIFGDTSSVTDFNYIFSECPSLYSIPENLFKNCSSTTEFVSTFGGCSLLKSIPSNIFNGAISATIFNYIFSESGLESIPEGLFDNCISAERFYYCFYNCKNLTSVPHKLFSNCINTKNFEYCFYNCTSLSSIPEDIFVGCDNITNLSRCFCGCNNLKDFSLKFTAKNISNINNFVTKKDDSNIVIKVPANSTTYTTFKNKEASFNIIVEEYE